MKRSKAGDKLDRLQQAVLDDLLSLSDEELRSELVQDGDDLSGIASRTRFAVQQKLAEEKRKRLSTARDLLRSSGGPPKPATRPPLDRIKEMVQAAFEGKPSLRVAYREGQRKSEADWQSMYDDLVDLGEIRPEQDD